MANTLWAKETAQRCSKENEAFRTESGESLIFNVDGQHDVFVIPTTEKANCSIS